MSKALRDESKLKSNPSTIAFDIKYLFRNSWKKWDANRTCVLLIEQVKKLKCEEHRKHRLNFVNKILNDFAKAGNEAATGEAKGEREALKNQGNKETHRA